MSAEVFVSYINIMPFNRSRIRIGTAEPGRLTTVNIVNSSNKMYRDTVAVTSEHFLVTRRDGHGETE